MIIAYISGITTLTLFFSVVFYHAFTVLCSGEKLWRKVKQRLWRYDNQKDENENTRAEGSEANTNKPTTSVVDGPPQRGLLLSVLLENNEIKTPLL